MLARSVLMTVLMVAAALAAAYLKPTQHFADRDPLPDLNVVIPKAFGDWQAEEGHNYIVNPQQREVLDKLYSQNFSRTYVRQDGYRIMLTIAYGRDQSDSLQVHRPEICYPAQGFQLNSLSNGRLETAYGSIPITRMVASVRYRVEPVTYWITVGDQAVQGNLNKKFAEMRYGFHDLIPDGLLFRVSSIDENSRVAFPAQEAFVQQLLAALAPTTRSRLAGLGAVAP